MRLPGLLVLAAAGFVAAILPSPASAGAGEGVGYRLTGQPGSTLERGFIRLPASAGSTVSAHFVASNTTKSAVNVAFYGADGDTTRATGAVYGSSSPTETGNWITPSRSSATLPPGSELTIDIAVRVPAGASSGDHVGAVIMEQQEGASTNTVKQVVRYGVPLLVDVGGGGGPQLELGTTRLDRIAGTEIAAAMLPMRNVGSRICRPVVTANVAGQGQPPMTVQRQLDEILPGDRIVYPLRLADSMAGGTYLVRADVTGCGTPSSTSTSATLESKNSGTTAPPTTPSTGNTADGKITPVPLKRNKGKTSTGGGDGSSDRSDTSAPRPVTPETDTEDDDQAAAVPPVPRKPEGRGWLRRAGDSIAENAPKVLERASVPLGASALVGLLFFLQNALDRRDPKLAGAPRDRDDALRFDPNPLHS